MSNNLTGQFIANTFQNLVQKPDVSKEEYFNGLGTPIFINADPIGTIKMFSPYPSGSLSSFFDLSTGLGLINTGWDKWAMCDGRNSTPDLRGRFITGYHDGGDGDGDYATIGSVGGNKKTTLVAGNLPPHSHTITVSKWGITSTTDGAKWTDPGNGDHDESKTTSNGPGTSTPFENRPPYYTLLYVIKIS